MRRILVVDDSALALHLVQVKLGERGFESVTARSSAEARGVELAGVHGALLDLELGDGLGTDLARWLRERTPALPIAFLSAATHASLLGDARAFGPVFPKGQLDAAIAWAEGIEVQSAVIGRGLGEVSSTGESGL